MRSVARLSAFGIGLIGALDCLILNILVSLFHAVARLTGSTTASHGFIGLLIVALAVIGAILALFIPRVGGVLLIIAGVAFFFVVHGWAVLSSPQLIIGGLIPFFSASAAASPRLGERSMPPGAASA